MTGNPSLNLEHEVIIALRDERDDTTTFALIEARAARQDMPPRFNMQYRRYIVSSIPQRDYNGARIGDEGVTWNVESVAKWDEKHVALEARRGFGV